MRRSFFSFFQFAKARRSGSTRALHPQAALMASAPGAVALYASAVAISHTKYPEPEDAHEKSHHLKGGKKFHNPWPSFKTEPFWSIPLKIIRHRFSGNSNSPDTTPPTVPVVSPKFLPTRKTDSLRATWLGHACFLVEFPSGLRVLFDPVFERCCGPYGWIGPSRFTEPPCQIEDIPFVDAVVISHSHYDHMSHPSILRIQAKFPNAQFFAPMNNKAWFENLGVKNVTEMDWWETRELKLSIMKEANKEDDQDDSPETMEAIIGCLPCQHMAARSPFDFMQTLWASWSVESGGKKVWFAGDTGYRAVPDTKGEDEYSEQYADLPVCPVFNQIGALRGPFDLGMIPIGAYQPRFLFSSMHASPADSVNIFLESKCKKALGMHWGTWVLTEEDVMEPPELLKKALKWKGVDEQGVFDICDIGESKEY